MIWVSVMHLTTTSIKVVLQSESACLGTLSSKWNAGRVKILHNQGEMGTTSGWKQKLGQITGWWRNWPHLMNSLMTQKNMEMDDPYEICADTLAKPWPWP